MSSSSVVVPTPLPSPDPLEALLEECFGWDGYDGVPSTDWAGDSSKTAFLVGTTPGFQAPSEALPVAEALPVPSTVSSVAAVDFCFPDVACRSNSSTEPEADRFDRAFELLF